MITRSKPPLERDYKIGEQGANCSTGTRDFENKEQIVRKRLENLRARRELLERD